MTPSEKLNHLANFLETHVLPHPETFDLTVWKLDGDCGTTACAVGWACGIPEFNDLGLCLERAHFGIAPLSPLYQRHGGWAAVTTFFDLDADTADYLFDSSAYKGLGSSKLEECIRRLREVADPPRSQPSPRP